ncbi:pyocin knob domain-containing protein [Gammaproteobacteria bacterium]|nr:pyocin knob domain-containing protein [Gammaproteobacteria bacterium]
MCKLKFDREQIKSWFEEGDQPTQEQFQFWIENCLYKFDDLDNIIFIKSKVLLPTKGKESILYFVDSEKTIYIWDVLKRKYIQFISASELASTIKANECNRNSDDIIPFCTKEVMNNGDNGIQFHYQTSGDKKLTYNSYNGLFKSYKIQGYYEPILLKLNDDLDTIVLPGSYVCGYSNMALSLLNCPTSNAFSFRVERTVNTKGAKQTIYDFCSPYTEYTRYMYDHEWSEWIKVWDETYGTPKSYLARRTEVEEITSEGYLPIPNCYFYENSGNTIAGILKGKNNLEYSSHHDKLQVGGIKSRIPYPSELFVADGTTVQAKRIIEDGKSIIYDGYSKYHGFYKLEYSSDALNGSNLLPVIAHIIPENNMIVELPFPLERSTANNTLILDSDTQDKILITLILPVTTYCDIPIKHIDNNASTSDVFPEQPDNESICRNRHYYEKYTKYTSEVSFYVYRGEPLIFKWFSRKKHYLKLLSN